MLFQAIGLVALFCAGATFTGAVISSANHSSNHHAPWLVNYPEFSQKGVLVRTKDIAKFKELPPVLPNQVIPTRAIDNEAYDALHRFFWGMEEGIVLEMGAMDGMRYSVSHDFLPYKWHRILIDATPKWRHAAKEVSRDATFISAAICNSNRRVHFLSRHGEDSINGIAEFMTENFIKDFHNKVYQEARKGGSFDLEKVDWSLFSPQNHTEGYPDTLVHFLHCLRLNHIVDTLNVKKINFFMLDVEGGELDVLKSIDFATISFDIICVEVEKGRRPPHYFEDVSEVLAKNGYEVVYQYGRNAWFKAKTYQPSSDTAPARMR